MHSTALVQRLLFPFLLMVALSPVAAPGFAESDTELSDEDRDAIQQVVSRQLDAFQRDDEAEAFSYAAPSIQAQFKTPAEFMRMVRTGYEAVYRPRSTRFLDAFVLSGQVVQPLEVIAPDESVVTAFYLMERQADGTWRISGCMLRAAEGRTT
jgi:hypothetical protein